MKQLLCQAFCASIDVQSVPIGFAVSTPYRNADGDRLLLYFVREGSGGDWRIEDDGTQIALLEAHGVDIEGKARGEALQYLLQEYGAVFDKDDRTVRTGTLRENDLGPAGVRFVALLLRLQDLALLSPQVVRNTWRDDALSAIRQTFGEIAIVDEDSPLSPELEGQEADAVLRPYNASYPPLAIYLATSEERALHAIVGKMEAEKYRKIAGNFALMVERLKRNPVKETTFSLAHSRLDAVLSYREATGDSFDKLARMIGVGPTMGAFQ